MLRVLAGVTGACLATLAAAGAVPDQPHLAELPLAQQEGVRVAAAVAPPVDFSSAEAFEANPAGAATLQTREGRDAFSQPSANMPFERELDFRAGNGLFRKLWVSAPSSTRASDGLGPLFNARSCEACHRRDGRGRPPDGHDGSSVSFVVRISVPAAEDAPTTGLERYLARFPDIPARTRPHPVYGAQLQPLAVAGQTAEIRLALHTEDTEVALSGGERVTLAKPLLDLTDPGFGPLGDDAMLSPRVAPAMIGLGLLEAIPAADILAQADPGDRDGDGISGRAQVVWSADQGRAMLGRFGHKAGMATLRDQVADALATDIGISSPLRPAPAGDCTPSQTVCIRAPHGDGDARGNEIDAAALDLLTFYARNLAVPARRAPGDPQVLAGKRVFHAAGCAACHRPKFVTARLADQPEQSFQLIWPYSDLLLHDLGEGLADHRPEGRATGREWRTAPLWGIGLTNVVSGHTRFLHDGRARSLLEAILWHGGEAAASRTYVTDLPKADRAALIRFLESL